MIVNISISVSGILAGIKRLDEGDLADRIRNCITKALYEWVTRRESPCFRDRFGPQAYAKMGLTHRKASYEKRQLKNLPGGIQPYAKPVGRNFLRLGKAIVRMNAQAILRAAENVIIKQEPMRTGIFKQGSGFTLQTKGSKKSATVTLRLPGAAILNRGGAVHAIWRRELTDLSLGGGRDAIWIWDRVHDLMDEDVWGYMARTPHIKLVG